MSASPRPHPGTAPSLHPRRCLPPRGFQVPCMAPMWHRCPLLSPWALQRWLRLGSLPPLSRPPLRTVRLQPQWGSDPTVCCCTETSSTVPSPYCSGPGGIPASGPHPGLDGPHGSGLEGDSWLQPSDSPKLASGRYRSPLGDEEALAPLPRSPPLPRVWAGGAALFPALSRGCAHSTALHVLLCA